MVAEGKGLSNKERISSLETAHIPEETRGREKDCNVGKTKHASKSKDMLASMENHLTGVETSVQEMREQLDEINNRLEG